MKPCESWNPSPEILNFYTIFDHPEDFPEHFVVRRFEYDQPTEEFQLADTLDAARALIPPGLFCAKRDENDAPYIVECWF